MGVPHVFVGHTPAVATQVNENNDFLDGRIDTEQAARIAGDAGMASDAELAAAIAAEVVARNAAIGVETAARIAADVLKQDAATAATDAELAAAIAAEVTARNTAITAAVWPAVVNALPGGPVDGQECHLLADAAAGIVFDLKYRAASANANKWESVGTSELAAMLYVDTQYSDGTGGWTTKNALALTIPFAGIYDIFYGLPRSYCGVDGTALDLSIDIGGAGKEGSTIAGGRGFVQGYSSIHGFYERAAVGAGDAVKLRTIAGNAWSSMNAYIRAIPVRL